MFRDVNLHWLVQPNCKINPKCFLVWRIVYTLLVIHEVIYHNAIYDARPLKELEFITIWAEYMTLIQSVCLVSLQIAYMCRRIEDYKIDMADPNTTQEIGNKCRRCFSKFLYIWYEIAFSWNPAVTLMFWGLMASWSTPLENYINVWLHGGLLVVMIVDFFMSQMHFKPRHWWVVLVPSFAYLLVNLIVTLADEPVYDFITFKSVLTYVYIVLTLGLIVGSFFMWYGFSVCKSRHISSRYYTPVRKGSSTVIGL